MKKILSIVLALAMCLGSIALLASCAGESAYDIAVKNGFEGDEAAWLESLKGDKGDKGDNGAKGDKGDAAQVPTIGENGNWFVGDTDTGVKATVIVDPSSFELVTAECGEVWSGTMPALEVKYNLVDPAAPATVVKECTTAITKDMIVGDYPFTTAGNIDFTITMLGMEQDLTLKVNTYYELKEATWTYKSTPAFTAVVKTLANGTSSEIALEAGMVTGTVDTAKLGVQTVDVKLDDTTAGKCAVNVIYYEGFDLEDTEVAKMGELLAKLGYKLPVIDKNATSQLLGTSYTQEKLNAFLAKAPDAVFPGTDINSDSDVLLKGNWNTPNLAQASIKDGRLYLRNNHKVIKDENDAVCASNWDAAIQILPEGVLDNFATVDANGNKLYSYTVQFDAEIARFIDASGETRTSDGFGLMMNTSPAPAGEGVKAGLQQSIRFRHYAIINGTAATGFGALSELSTAAGRPAFGPINGNGFMTTNQTIVTALFPNGQPEENEFAPWRLWAPITYRFVVTPEGLTVYGKTEQVEDFVVICATDWANSKATQEGYTAVMNSGNALYLYLTMTTSVYFDNIAVWAGTGEMPTLPVAPEVAE